MLHYINRERVIDRCTWMYVNVNLQGLANSNGPAPHSYNMFSECLFNGVKRIRIGEYGFYRHLSFAIKVDNSRV